MNSQSFRLLWMSQALANSGDIIYIVGLIAVLYRTTESPFILALVPFLTMIGRFISGLLSPLLLNRYPLKQLLVYSQVFKTITLGILVVLVFQSFSVLSILVFVFVIAFLDGWAAPASQAMVPRLVAPHELVKANSFFSIVYETVNLGGWALGGLFVAFAGGHFVLLWTVAVYIIATALLMKLVDPTVFTKQTTTVRRRNELVEGWMLIVKRPLFRSLHVTIAFEAVASVVWIASILYVFVTEILGETEAWWGYLNTAFFVGMLVGGIFFSRFASVTQKLMKRILLISSFGICGVTILFGFTQIGWVALVLVGLSGVFQQLKGIATDTYLQQHATADELPKVYAAQSALVSLLFAISSVGFGLLAELWDVRITYLLSGALLLLASVLLYKQRRHLPTIK